MGVVIKEDEIMFKDTPDCPIRDVVNRLGERWGMMIIIVMAKKPTRFSSLKKNVEGISPKMLTQTLRNLEREGYISRTVYPEVPVRVEYELTDLGRALLKSFGPLIGWAREHHDEVRIARQKFDEAQEH